MKQALDRRIARVEDALQLSRRRRFHVLSNIGDRGEFYGRHGRFMTNAEMDAEEAELFASGKALPGELVDRIIIRIVTARDGRPVEVGH